MPRTGNPKWKKGGPSPNPTGRPREYPEFREACRALSPKALAVLEGALQSEDKKLAVLAAGEVLNRAWGRPSAALTGEGGEGPAAFTVTWMDPAAVGGDEED